MLRLLATAGVALVLSLAPRATTAAESTAVSPDPRSLGRVLILPFLGAADEAPANESPQEAEQRRLAREQEREMAHFEVESRFRMFNIEYVRRPELAAALATQKLDPTRASDRTKAKLKALADALKCRWLVTGAIQDSGGSWRRKGVVGEGKAEATVQVQVFDARAERFADEFAGVASAASQSKTLGSRSFSRTEKRRVKVVRDATQKALALFLRPFPLVYAEDPGEAFVVYELRRDETETPPTATASTPAAFSANPVVIKLTLGTTVEGTIQKLENGFYTVLTKDGKVTIAQEHVISVTEQK